MSNLFIPITVMIPIVSLIVLQASRAIGANILILHPFNLRGHSSYLSPLAEALVERNHRVTVVSAERGAFDENTVEVIPLYNHETPTKLSWENSRKHFMSDVFRVHEYASTEVRSMFKSKPFRSLLEANRTFDAIISNTYMFGHSLSVVAHLFNALHIEFTPQGDNPISSLWSGNIIQGVSTDPQKTWIGNFFQKAKLTWETTILLMYNRFVIMAHHESILEETCKFTGCETRPPLRQLLSSTSAILAHSHPTLSTPPSVSLFQKQVAGISIRPLSPLPSALEKFINGSNNGFIVMSWGTVVPCCSGRLGNIVLNGLSQLKERVILKSTTEKFSRSVPENVLVSSWIPQADLLGDKRIKLFLTHGGFSSMVETVHYGVPVVVTPSSLDQPKNAAHMVAQGMGVLLSFDNITVDSLVWAIEETIGNPEYRRRATEMSKLFTSRLISPKEDAIFTIENALKHKHVVPNEHNYVLSIFLIANADVFLVSLIIPTIVVIMLRPLLRLLTRSLLFYSRRFSVLRPSFIKHKKR